MRCLKKFGYKFGHTQWGGLKLYKDNDNVIIFNYEKKSFYKTGEFDGMCDNISMQELKAINKKVEEMRVVR